MQADLASISAEALGDGIRAEELCGRLAIRVGLVKELLDLFKLNRAHSQWGLHLVVRLNGP